MNILAIVEQVRELLRRQGRVSYRILQRQFGLDADALEDLKFELIEVQELAVDKDGKMLVWTGNGDGKETETRRIGESGPSPLPLEPSIQLSPAERRQLTVMFCDLVGSTALSGQLDPEELREVVRAYQQTSAEVIERYSGSIAQYLGDGLLVYFGYPVAHEDDAARAVRAGLEIIANLQQQVPSPLTGEPVLSLVEGGQSKGAKEKSLQVRIGIHTGPVVVGEMGSGKRHEQLALGETPNIAARVQGKAEPNEVIISAATYRLVEGLFECEDRGHSALKGVSTPLTLYHVVKEGEAQSRFQVVARKGLTPLVGREHEYGLLRERWQRVKEGQGQIVLLSGEPGIGKSRLVEALKDSIAHEGARCWEFRCSPYAQNSALQPVIEHLQRRLQSHPEDTPETKLGKLQQTVSRHNFSQVDTLPLLASLLSLPHPEGCPPLILSPQKQKEKTHRAVVAWLCEDALQQAMMYAWEDLHWADPSTLELLTLLLDQVPTSRLLVVLTYRPEFTPPWGAHSYLSQLTLNRLGRNQVEMMVERVTGGKALPAEVVQQIVDKTDGVPLFVEELTKSVIESVESIGSIESPNRLPHPFTIPATLQDSLMARLDRLGMAKEIAQLGATIGREFQYGLLRAISPLDKETLQQRLRQLVDSELVFQSGVPLQDRYLFKHALVQDTAYQSLLKSNRQQLHQQIAQVLEERFPETVETQPELVAHHYTEAALIEQAIPYWQRAGEKAVQHSAHAEAISHFTKGLEVLQTLIDTPERTHQELTLQIALGRALMAIKGYAAPEVGQVYARARELCRQVGETPQLFSVLTGLNAFYQVRAEHQTARELAEQCLSLAQRVHNRALLMWAHNTLGHTLFYLGELTLTRDHMEQGIALYDPQEDSPHVSGAPNDPGMSCLGFASWSLWHLGYPDQALKRSQESLILAQELSHPFSVAYALVGVTTLHQLRREEQTAHERAGTLMTLSSEQGFVQFLAHGTIFQGKTLVDQGQGEEGIAQICQGMAADQASGGVRERPYYLALLAEAYGKVGRTEEGLTALVEALDQVEKTGERRWEAELYRLKGELTLQAKVQGPKAKVEKEGEACFLKAIEIAQKQQAKSLELRAATSLARLWQQQGKRAEAYDLLAPVYNWFTEGFDTKDLQEAKALLNALS